MSAATLSIAPSLRRQPLTPVGRTRIRALQQTKLSLINKLNASVPSTPLKRSFSYDSDGENFLPCIKSDPIKRKRTIEDDGQLSGSPKALKASRISLVTIENKTPEIAIPRNVNVTMTKPAGRSLQANTKLSKAFGRRSQRNSLASNTIRNASYLNSKTEPVPSRKVTQPPSWHFDIHVDTQEEESTNTMQHFAGRLDISDDEGKEKHDDSNKENVPPHELGITLPAVAQPVTIASRKNMMAQFRSPLGELKASDYYGAGLHGLSYAIIHDDESLKVAAEQLNTSAVPKPSNASVLPKTLSLATFISASSQLVDRADETTVTA